LHLYEFKHDQNNTRLGALCRLRAPQAVQDAVLEDKQTARDRYIWYFLPVLEAPSSTQRPVMLDSDDSRVRSRKGPFGDGVTSSTIGSGRRFAVAPRDLSALSAAGASAAVLFVVGTLGFKAFEALSWTDAAFAATGIVSSVGVVVPPTSALSRAFVAVLNAASMTVGAVAIAELAEVQKRLQLRRGGVSELQALVATAVPLLLIASAFFSWSEGLPFGTAAYIAFTTASGLGFTEGLELRQPLSRRVFVIFIFGATGITMNLLGIVGASIINWAQPRLKSMSAVDAKDYASTE
jgi:hypothetical protein